jgi:hypothetical protein
VVRPPSRRTSLPTNSYAGGSLAMLGTPRCSNSSSLLHQLRWGSPATLGTPRCSDSSSLHHQLRWGLARYARDFPAFGFFIASSSATLGACQLRWGFLGVRIIHRFIISYSRARHLHWGLLGIPVLRGSSMSHRCAIKLLHAVRIRVLILGSTSGILIRI